MSEIMRGNRKSDTRPEVELRSALHRAGLRFRKDYAVRPDGGRVIRVDVAFPRVRVAVFIDGCFWHRCPEHGNEPRSNRVYWDTKLSRNVERDREVEARLSAAGWRVLRVWEHSVRSPNAKALAVAQVAAVAGREPTGPPAAS